MDRVIAVDWSGAKARGGRGAIAWAEVTGGGIERLETDLDRDGVIRSILNIRDPSPTLIAFDFAFSLPKWYLDERHMGEAQQLWAELAGPGAQGAESLIQRCEPPFWGRPGKPRPHEPALGLRKADRECGGKPVFQLGGAGSVGTGSLRGMPYLPVLREAGWAIWPFDQPGERVVVEMYPRNLYRLAGIDAVRKSDPASRDEAIGQISGLKLSAKVRAAARSSEHAFDALTAACGLWNGIRENGLRFPEPDDLERLEGMVFQPGDPAD